MLVSIRETAEALNVSHRHVRRMIDAGRVPFYLVGERAIRLDLDEVKAAIRSRRCPDRKQIDSPTGESSV
jgi:excisionase family DNA binding protein